MVNNHKSNTSLREMSSGWGLMSGEVSTQQAKAIACSEKINKLLSTFSLGFRIKVMLDVSQGLVHPEKQNG